VNKFNKLKNLNVLYVEDELDVREEVEDILNMKVGQLLVATNGQDGLEKYKKHNPDIIITDIKMPVMNGIEMIKEVRSLNIDIPIIITSAFNETEFFKSAIDLHVDKYIIKPIDIMQLFAVLDRAALVIYQKQELQHKDAMLKNKEKITAFGELLENIAHQWRQPLSMITTSASSLQVQKYLGKVSNELVEEMCENINNNAQKLSNTIDKFAKFFDDKESEEQLNLKFIIEDYLSMIETSFKEKNITLLLNLSDISITAVKKDIIQVLFTIVTNAKDKLLQNNVNNRFICIELYEENKNIFLTIHDSGGGIDEEYIDKVFDPYFTTKHQSQGTGLGLYLVYELIQNFIEGSIEVSNESFIHEKNEYYGAKFIVSL